MRIVRLFVALSLVAMIPAALAAQHSPGKPSSPSPSPSSSSNSSGSNNSSRSMPATNGDTGVPLSTADAEGKVEFRTQTVLVQVPVVVTDKGGNHVHGLTKADLHVFENGKEQQISAFEEVVASTAKISTPAPQPGEFRNLTIPDNEAHNITVIALDTVNTPFLDQTRGRHELVKYLAESLNSGQVMSLMIITGNGLRIVQGLTGDSESLIKMLKQIGGELPATVGTSETAQADAVVGGDEGFATSITNSTNPAAQEAAMRSFVEHGDAVIARFQQQNAIETTLNGLMGIAWTLSGLPGRKSLIWATGGFPFALASPATVPGGYLSTLYERTMEALTQAQISVYPVDVRGLVIANPIGDARTSRTPTLNQINNRAWLQQSKIDSLEEFADMTGGKAFYNTNDLVDSFKRAADDASSYYLVGYYLDTHNDHAGWRQLKVKVDKKDTDVRARKGFFVTNATLHMELSRRTDLEYALVSPVEGTGVPLVVKLTGVTGDGASKKAAFAVHLPPNAVTLDAGGPGHLNFDFAVAAYAVGTKGMKAADSYGKTFSTTVTETQLAMIHDKGVGFNPDLNLGPGQYAVRFVVRDNVTGKVGSVTMPLTVN
jgi:VWFA-related protein